MAGDTETANSILDEALTIDPLNWDVNKNYAYFILYKDAASGGGYDYQGMLDYLEEYRAKLPDDNENITEVESLIASVNTAMENEKTDTDDSGDDNHR